MYALVAFFLATSYIPRASYLILVATIIFWNAMDSLQAERPTRIFNWKKRYSD